MDQGCKVYPRNLFEQRMGVRGETTNYYRPMMYVIYMLTHYLFGIAPWGFHLVSAVFHAGSSVLVFLIAGILFSKYKSPSKYLSIPLMAAVLFAVHPIHTEAVNWVSCVPELSYSLFCLLSFLPVSPVRQQVHYRLLPLRSCLLRGYVVQGACDNPPGSANCLRPAAKQKEARVSVYPEEIRPVCAGRVRLPLHQVLCARREHELEATWRVWPLWKLVYNLCDIL